MLSPTVSHTAKTIHLLIVTQARTTEQDKQGELNDDRDIAGCSYFYT